MTAASAAHQLDLATRAALAAALAAMPQMEARCKAAMAAELNALRRYPLHGCLLCWMLQTTLFFQLHCTG